MQQAAPNNIHLIYRELLAPQPMFESYVRNKLYRIHQFMTELVEEAVACGEIVTEIKATHVAFTLEGIIMFFFLTQSQIRELGNFKQGTELDYLLQALNTYLASLSKNNRYTKTAYTIYQKQKLRWFLLFCCASSQLCCLTLTHEKTII